MTFTINKLDPGQNVTVTILTRVRPDVKPPFIIINQAGISNTEDLTVRTAQAVLMSISELPATGESPWWRLPVLLLIGLTMAAVTLTGAKAITRARRR